MFEHILIPLDFTSKNEAALRVAMQLGKQSESHVTLMHVIETIEYADDQETSAFYESLTKRAKAKLAEFAQRFTEENIPTAQEVVVGKTASGIVSFAMQEGVDLIVLSSHRVKLDQPPHGWATLSHQVSILSQCPVMLVK